MREHLILISEATRASAAELAEHQAARGAYVAAHRAQISDHGRLHPSSAGVRMRARGIERGPFAGAIDRFYQVRDADLAAELPIGPGDIVDVRPLMKGDVVRDKLDRPGKSAGALD